MTELHLTIKANQPINVIDSLNEALRALALESVVDDTDDDGWKWDSISELADVEDGHGNLWEPPDSEGRIRVCDLDGNVVAWYDPGDTYYKEALGRFFQP